MSISLLPVLRASSSRLSSNLSSPLRRQFHASPHRSAVEFGTTVQSADTALADLKRATTQMQRNSIQVDLSALSSPIVERIVDPPFKWTWIFRSKGRSYATKRFERYRITRKCLNDMIEKDAIRKRKGKNPFDKILQAILCLRPTYKAGFALEDVRKVYERLNKAQATGDEVAIRSLAIGEAFALAQRVAKTKRAVNWDLVKMNAAPKLASARLAPLDSAGRLLVAQVVVTFDSDQALTVKTPMGVETKSQRVVENCVFEQRVPAMRGWKLKESIPVTIPDI